MLRLVSYVVADEAFPRHLKDIYRGQMPPGEFKQTDWKEFSSAVCRVCEGFRKMHSECQAEGFQLGNRRPKQMNCPSIRIQPLSFLATVQSSDSTFLAGFITVERC